MSASSKRLMYLLLCCFLLIIFSSNSQADTSQRSPAPSFTLPLIGSSKGTISLADLKGKVVYLDFWATWCPPCRKSFPWMQDIYQRYKDKGLAVVAVSVNARQKDAEKFIKEHNPNFITAFDSGKKTAKTYKLEAMPSSYLIDRQGKIISTHLGFRTSNISKVETEIQQALKE
jgi:cytochrome c biogenesis protein CcmG/thiol:disulfide interchange protein DsbE